MAENNLRRLLKIIAGCQDPGGYNAILPIVKELRIRGYNVEFLASGYSARIIRKMNVVFSKTLKQNFASIEKSFVKTKPNVVLIGTSLGYSLENVLVMLAQKYNVPSIAVLDSWVSYSKRFSGLSSGEKFRYLPNIVCVMDDIAKNEMINEGIPPDRIRVTGNPYFDNFREEIMVYLSEKSNFLKDKGLASDVLIVSFFSQSIDKSFGSNNKNPNFLGYTQFDAFRLLINTLSEIKKNKELKIALIVRPHPKEESDSYDFFKNETNDISLIIDNDNEHRKVLAISDIICGMFSSILIEAYMFGKKIISIQPNLSKSNPFVLSRLGIVNTIRTSEELKRQLESFFSNGNNKVYFSSKIIQGNKATNNVIKLIEDTGRNYGR